jgi:hypothetical protein
LAPTIVKITIQLSLKNLLLKIWQLTTVSQDMQLAGNPARRKQ